MDAPIVVRFGGDAHHVSKSDATFEMVDLSAVALLKNGSKARRHYIAASGGAARDCLQVERHVHEVV